VAKSKSVEKISPKRLGKKQPTKPSKSTLKKAPSPKLARKPVKPMKPIVSKSARPVKAKAVIKKAPTKGKAASSVARAPLTKATKKVASKPAPSKTASVIKLIKPAAKSVAKSTAKSTAKSVAKSVAKSAVPAPVKPTVKTPAVASLPTSGKSAARGKAGVKPIANEPVEVVKPITKVPGVLSLAQSVPVPRMKKMTSAEFAASMARPKKIIKAKKVPRPELPPVRLPPPPVTSDSKMQKNRAGISTREIEHFRDLLLEKRRELLGDVTSMEREALRSGNTNLSSLPMHTADTGTDNYEQEFTLGLVEKDRQLLREINGSLAKIQDGSFGICEGTGKPISAPRLEAQPWAKYGIEHARQLERRMFRRSF